MRTLINILVSFVSVSSFASPSQFSTADCEAFLLGPEGEDLIWEFQEWWTKLPPIRAKIRDGQVLYDPNDPDDIEAGEESELMSNQEIREELRKRAVRAQPGLGGRGPAYFEKPLLTSLQKAALGIPLDMEIRKEEANTILFKHGELGVFNRRHQLLGQFILNADDIHLGFTNNLANWRANEGREAYTTDTGYPALQRFLTSFGQILLLRNYDNLRFGYLTAINTVDQPITGVDYLIFEVFLVRDCDKLASTRNQIIFPKAFQETGRLNLCLIPLDLRFERHP